MNEATQEYIREHANDDVRQLALGRVPADVNLHEALTQIEGRQLAMHKCPTCAATDGFLFPPRLSMEQCSSEVTAAYKREIITRLVPSLPLGENGMETELSFADLTGGLGIDFMSIAPLFRRAVYVERNPDLCELARHNLPIMGCSHAEIICEEISPVHFPLFSSHFSFAFIDPSRRDTAGRKVSLIEDCNPDVCTLQDLLRHHAHFTLIKLSPMLDLTAALRALRGIQSAHVVSVAGECKELLLVMGPEESRLDDIPIHCVDLEAPHVGASCYKLMTSELQFTLQEEKNISTAPLPDMQQVCGAFLYEPNASILKAGAFKTVSRRFPVQKLASDTHLYISDQLLADFPGRCWHILDQGTFNKKDLKRLLAGVDAAELTVRGFPMSVASLRKQLRLRDGGTAHFIATSFNNQKHLLRVEKV